MLDVFDTRTIQKYIPRRRIYISADIPLIVAGISNFLFHFKGIFYHHNLNHFSAPFG